MPSASQVLAARLRELRLRAGLSQEELARSARVSRAYLSDLERAEKEAGIEVVVRLARALAVEPGVLLTGAMAVVPNAPRSRRVKKRRLTSAERLGQQVARLAADADEDAIRRFATVARAFFPRGKRKKK